MSKSSTYDPRAIEGPIYDFWEQGGYFHAEPHPDKKPFTIVIPPPNVTGSLHLGHAINNTLQDVMIRRKRMQGFNACWLPGIDHAGIATQAVVERKLKEEEGKTRHEVGREGLVERIWAWKQQYGDRIIEQLRKMGCSCDWQRTRFTLDEMCARAVYETFFRLFKDGLIYRGLRLVNWDAFLQTAVADDEIVYQKVKGHLWHVRYWVEGGAGILPARQSEHPGAPGQAGMPRSEHEAPASNGQFLVIATTRPETMLGDTALAVHPDDPRYKHLIGGHVILPLVNRRIPIIADELLVKQEFGTGVVKVTPGHDPHDYACGLRNGLPQINILTPDGRVRDDEEGKRLFGPYAGLDRYAARKKIVADLESAGLLEKAEPYEHEVGHSDRSKTPIEPLLSEQWFVKMGGLAEAAMEAVRDGRVQFFPERYAKSYLDWLGEKRDWCISRQLWWGHRIPVWTFRSGPNADSASAMSKLRIWIEEGRVAARGVAQGRLGADGKTVEIRRTGFCPDANLLREFETFASHHSLARDEDALDTWFSSALWPFSTFGWPDSEEGSRDQGNKGSRENTDGGASIPRSLDPSIPSVRAGCPHHPDFAHFYPTTVLSTARDIITLWVARMVMLGLYETGERPHQGRVPFQHVFIHPVIQDGQGRRMSKSAGNGVDPLDLIEMYGADAMRFTLASMAGETQDIRVPVKPVATADGRQINTSERFELGRNFCNKLWQAAMGFVLPNLTGSASILPARTLALSQLAMEDRWILSRLQRCIAEVDRRIDSYQFAAAADELYSFFWSDFCDWYVELVKPRLYPGDRVSNSGVRVEDSRSPVAASADVARQVLAYVLDQTLRLLHPIVPFVTEALWRELNAAAPFRGISQLEAGGNALIVESWPRVDPSLADADVDRRMDRLQEAIRALRDVKARVNGIRAQARETVVRTLPRAVIRADAGIAAEFTTARDVLCRLGQCDQIEIGVNAAMPPESASKVFSGFEVYVPLTGLANLDLERARLGKEIEESRGHIERTAAKLANEGFLSSAPPAIVERERTRLNELREKLATLEENLSQIGG